MRVTNIRTESRDGVVRRSARFDWEERPRDPATLSFSLPSSAELEIADDGNAFLAAGVLVAMHHGERRLSIDAEICPRLAEGAAMAVETVRAWHGPVKNPVAIETLRGFRLPFPRNPGRSALLFSGGVHAFDALLENREFFPPGHPRRFTALVAVEGLDPAGAALSPVRLARLRTAAGSAGIPIATISANFRELESDLGFVSRQFLGAALAATAHVLSPSFDGASIAAAWDVSHGVRCGSHAFVDPAFSSGALALRHEGLNATRLEKVSRVAARRWALENLTVCTDAAAAEARNHVNCGRCERCLRTRVELEALGVSAEGIFPEGAIDAGELEALHLAFNHDYFWEPLVAPLEARGRRDLAAAAARLIAEARRIQAWFDELGWKGRLRGMDRELLGGFLGRVLRRSA